MAPSVSKILKFRCMIDKLTIVWKQTNEIKQRPCLDNMAMHNFNLYVVLGYIF